MCMHIVKLYCNNIDTNKISKYPLSRLSQCLNNKEKETTWRLWHEALLTPKIALNMKLYHSNKCPLCDLNDPTTKHYLNCEYFESVWLFIKKTVERSGQVWSDKLKKLGIQGNGKQCLNNLIFTAHSLIYETFIYEFNNYQYNCNPLIRYKQKIFEILYLEFHLAKLKGELSILKYSIYWQKCDFFFKIMNNSIDIRIN